MRALFHLRRFDAAIAIAERTDVTSLVAEEAVPVTGLHIICLSRAGRLGEAKAKLPPYRASVDADDRIGRLEVELTSCDFDYCTGKFLECVAKLERVLAATATVVDERRRYAFQRDAYVSRALAATMLGVIHNAYGRFADAERAQFDALLSAEQATPRDALVEAVILANLSCSIAESYSASAIQLLYSRMSSFKWNAGLVEQRERLKQNLRVAAYLFGSSGESVRGLGRSSPSLSLRLADCLNSLALDDWTSSDVFAREFAFASDILARVDWQGTDGEEFLVLNSMAAIAAPFDLAAATEAQDLYRRKAAALTPHLTICVGVRNRPHLDFTSACVAKARGDWGAAKIAFEAAVAGWLSYGIVWRAAIAAVELFTLTREETLLEIARKFIAAHPGTPFSRRLGRAVGLAADAERGAFIYLKEAVIR
jgi:hypothetical protein